MARQMLQGPAFTRAFFQATGPGMCALDAAEELQREFSADGLGVSVRPDRRQPKNLRRRGLAARNRAGGFSAAWRRALHSRRTIRSFAVVTLRVGPSRPAPGVGGSCVSWVISGDPGKPEAAQPWG